LHGFSPYCVWIGLLNGTEILSGSVLPGFTGPSKSTLYVNDVGRAGLLESLYSKTIFILAVAPAELLTFKKFLVIIRIDSVVS
jgi:hypothetical protein